MTDPSSEPTGHDPTCRELTELATELLDGALAPDVRSVFEAHVAGCDGCAAHLDQLRTAIDMVHRAGGRSLDPATRDRALATIREATEAHDPTTG